MSRDTRFDVPFPMKCAVDEHIRQLQMGMCIAEGFPYLKAQILPLDSTESISIACYGPSLEDTWQDLTRPIVSMSGAHDFLLAHGVIPDYHIEMDPRPHKVNHLKKPHPLVQYLMASVCHPWMWKVLKGFNVQIFHVISGANTYAWLQEHAPASPSLLVVAGSSIGLGSIHLGGTLGYRHFEIHGMDGCFRGSVRHAGPHYGHNQAAIPWTANGRTWYTSKIMANSNVELLNMAREFPFLGVLHGQGLVQDMVADADLPNLAVVGTEKADLVRSAIIEVVEEGSLCGAS